MIEAQASERANTEKYDEGIRRADYLEAADENYGTRLGHRESLVPGMDRDVPRPSSSAGVWVSGCPR